MRITENTLKAEAGDLNRRALNNYRVNLIGVQGRNGYKAIDHYFIDANGAFRCQTNIETGTAKECLNAAYRFNNDQSEQVRTREQAKAVLILLGVDFEKDFYEVSLHLASALTKLAKMTGYKKPRNANGSLTRYFFEHLSKPKYKHLTLDSMHASNLLNLENF